MDLAEYVLCGLILSVDIISQSVEIAVTLVIGTQLIRVKEEQIQQEI